MSNDRDAFITAQTKIVEEFARLAPGERETRDKFWRLAVETRDLLADQGCMMTPIRAERAAWRFDSLREGVVLPEPLRERWRRWDLDYPALLERNPCLELRDLMQSVSERQDASSWPYEYEWEIESWVAGGDLDCNPFGDQVLFDRLRELHARLDGWLYMDDELNVQFIGPLPEFREFGRRRREAEAERARVEQAHAKARYEEGMRQLERGYLEGRTVLVCKLRREPMSRAHVVEAMAALQDHARGLQTLRTSDLFAADPDRFMDFSVARDDLLFDFSKHRVSRETLRLLIDLARAADVEGRRDALFSGEAVNSTEHRAAGHMALRNLSDRPWGIGGEDVSGVVAAERAKVYEFARAIRSGALRGARGEPFSDIVNIGIGGSDLGPAMAARALSPFTAGGPRAHFVSNVDGADLADALKTLDPARTLFIVSSKTFTTQETMTNAQSARAFIVEALGEAAVGAHFAAVSTRLDKVAAFGIDASRVFGFWDWVGGRYSLWSSIGLSLAIAIGPEHFTEFLRGGADIDAHFVSAPLERNIPVLMALIGVFHRNVEGRAAHAVIPYDQRLARFPAYLQQLDMESNGKSVTCDGDAAEFATGPIIFGEPGTNGQHAFFQLLHQGTDVTPIDFLVAAEPIDADPHHHALLFANCLAQSEAFMRGRTLTEVKALLAAQGLGEAEIEALAPHKVFSGDRPSSVLLYKRLDPRTLGRLVALYEHKVFVQSVIWDINPFDQWGVELGKELANRLAPIVENASAPLDGLDGSTAGLIRWRREVERG